MAVPSLRSQNDGVMVTSGVGAVDSVFAGDVSVEFVLVMLVTFGALMRQIAKIPMTGLHGDSNALV
jgi:hypothetical protein